MIEGSRFAAGSDRDRVAAKDVLKALKYFPSAVNLPVD